MVVSVVTGTGPGRSGSRPRVALTLGDPSGIGPELVARLLADQPLMQAAEVYLVGDRDELLRGQRIAGVASEVGEAASIAEADFTRGRPVLQHVAGIRGGFPHGAASAAAGAHALRTLGIAVDIAAAGGADAVCFAPLNKKALHDGGNPFDDELHWLADRLGVSSYVCEINVADGVWSSRVTSHVPLRDVGRLLTVDRIVDAIVLIDRTMRDAGIARPRIAVCGLNPHLGDGGLVGREEIDVIGPAIERAAAIVPGVVGPFPADRLFLRVRDGDYDGVVTMFHDQGQIALKLMTSGRAVSLQGGLPVPVTTPAHGTAYDIAGTGRADPAAMRLAFELACAMGARQRQRGARGDAGRP